MPDTKVIIDNLEETKKSCFIITPIGKDSDPIRRHIDGIIEAAIEPVLEKYDYEVYIPHHMSMPGSIDKQIIKKIHDCDLVIANLTDINPNVMYELALRHCFGTPSIMIAEKDTKLPFDIGTQRTIFYVNDAKGVLSLKQDLGKAIEELYKNDDYESPIVSVLKEFEIEEKIIKDKANSIDKLEANAWSIVFEKLNRIEQNISRPRDNVYHNSSNKLEYELTISGEKEIEYKTREKLRCLMKKMNVDYIMERSSDDLLMSLIIQFPMNANWIDFKRSVHEICEEYKLKYIINRISS